jgi:AraC family transcriptional regulator, arabinose operon regulatory protein
MTNQHLASTTTFLSPRLSDPHVDRRIRVALQLLTQDDCARPDSTMINHVLKVLNLSGSRFRHLFKSETGLSLTQLFKEQRLRKARTLLKTTFLSVKQITALLRVNDVSHFTNDYHAAFGETPTQTRRNQISKTRQTIAISANKHP